MFHVGGCRCTHEGDYWRHTGGQQAHRLHECSLGTSPAPKTAAPLLSRPPGDLQPSAIRLLREPQSDCTIPAAPPGVVGRAEGECIEVSLDGDCTVTTRGARTARTVVKRRRACLFFAPVMAVLYNVRSHRKQDHGSEAHEDWAFVADSPSWSYIVSALCPHLPLYVFNCTSVALPVGAYGRPSERTPSQDGTRVHSIPGFRRTAVAVRGSRIDYLQRGWFEEALGRPQRRCGRLACVHLKIGDTHLLDQNAARSASPHAESVWSVKITRTATRGTYPHHPGSWLLRAPSSKSGSRHRPIQCGGCQVTVFWP